MSKIIFIRHAESYANVGDLAFGNFDSPLTENAIKNQIPKLKKELIEKYKINPDSYDLPVASSAYNRAFQTASELGFKNIDKLPLLGEVDIPDMTGLEIKQKHLQEGWLPEDDYSVAQKIIQNFKNGVYKYEVLFTHGVVIASLIDELNKSGDTNISFDSTRGYIPKQAEIVELEIK